MKKLAFLFALLFTLLSFSACSLNQDETSGIPYADPVITPVLPIGMMPAVGSGLSEDTIEKTLLLINDTILKYSNSDYPLQFDNQLSVTQPFTQSIPSGAGLTLNLPAEEIYIMEKAFYQEPVENTPEDTESSIIETPADSAGEPSTETPSETPAEENVTDNFSFAENAEEFNYIAAVFTDNNYMLFLDISRLKTLDGDFNYNLNDSYFYDSSPANTSYLQLAATYGTFYDVAASRIFTKGQFLNVTLPGIPPVLHGNIEILHIENTMRLWLEDYGYFCFSIASGKVTSLITPQLDQSDEDDNIAETGKFNYRNAYALGEYMLENVTSMLTHAAESTDNISEAV